MAQTEVPRAAPIRALLIRSRLSDDSSEDIRKKVTTCLINKKFSVPIIKISSTRSKGVSILLSKETDVDFLEKELKAIDSLTNFDINRSRLRKPQGHESFSDHRFIGVRILGDLPVSDFYLKAKHGSQKFLNVSDYVRDRDFAKAYK
ncbi:hypothetical protein TNCV_4251981 [Trichonephila clavipes]|nr:hypothetical protein TNCV_4251981 [Trichonephila clavipes]